MPSSTDVVRTAYECLGRDDLDGLANCFADDCEIEVAGPKSIPYAGKYRGRNGARQLAEKYTGTCDVLEYSAEEFHADGEFVTVVCREHCRAKDTGREWDLRLIDTFVVRDGKIRKFNEYFDTAAVAEAFAGAGTRPGVASGAARAR